MSLRRAFAERRPLVSPEDAWKFRDFVMVAASASVMPKAFSMLEPTVSLLRSNGAGPIGSVAWGAAASVSLIAVVGFTARLAADPALAAAARAASAAGAKISDNANRLRTFFDRAGISMEHRKAVITRNRSFAVALRQGLEAAGVPNEMIYGRWATTVAADARDMDPVVTQVLQLPNFIGADRTLLANRPFGDEGPTAMRRLADGTAAATWVGLDGTPIRTVGYSRDGSPAWIFDHETSEATAKDGDLFDEGDLYSAQIAMAAALQKSGSDYKRSRDQMMASFNPETHVMEELDGFISTRTLDGRLDAAPGCPAMLGPDGSTVFARNGRRINPAAYEMSPVDTWTAQAAR